MFERDDNVRSDILLFTGTKVFSRVFSRNNIHLWHHARRDVGYLDFVLSSKTQMVPTTILRASEDIVRTSQARQVVKVQPGLTRAYFLAQPLQEPPQKATSVDLASVDLARFRLGRLIF